MLLAPSLVLAVLFAEGIYSEISLRVIGALMLSLAIVVTGVIEFRAEQLYLQLIYALVPAILGLAYVYWDSLDRMWLISLLIVLAGWFLSVGAFLLDRRKSTS
jgi:hypothetical protein